MAQKQPVKKKQGKEEPVTPVVETPQQLPGLAQNKWLPYLLIFILSCALYSNTVLNKYASDDTMVLTDNKFTKQGIAGIKDLMTHDAFVGFFGERGSLLVSGGRYRPLSMVTFAIEYEMYGLTPAYSHAINVILFGFCCLSIYYLLTLIIPAAKGKPFYLSIPFLAAILYTAHPIHTEAVANIKGRDEIMGMLFSILALIAAIKYVKTQNLLHIVWGFGVYFLALLSKENSITFFVIVPMTYYFFTKAKAKDYALTLVAYGIAVGIFLGLRTAYTASTVFADSPEVLNNPFVYVSGPSEKYATIILTFLYYFKQLVVPHPLTHDYYFNQIPYVDFSNIGFIASFIINGGLVIYALLNIKNKSIPAYGILFYYITFGLASNLVFTVGVLMNERFIFMSSLGFSLIVAYLLVKAVERKKLSPTLLGGIVGVVLMLYSVKTFTRNFDWKDNFTLFRRDVRWSPNSAKVQTSAGGDMLAAANGNIATLKSTGELATILKDFGVKDAELSSIMVQPDTTIRKIMIDTAISHLNEALRIYPTHVNALNLLGNAYFNRNHKPQEVVDIYKRSVQLSGYNNYDAMFNLGFVYNEMNMADSAKVYLLGAARVKPEQEAYKFILPIVYAKLNKQDSVEVWLKIAAQVKPVDAEYYYKIGTAFGKVAGNLPLAIQYLAKAAELNPKVELYLEDLGVAYGLSGNYDAAIATSLKLYELNPNYPAAYNNLMVSYANKGNMAAAKEWEMKRKQKFGS